MKAKTTAPERWRCEEVFDEDQYKLAGLSITHKGEEVAFIAAVPDEDGNMDDMVLTKEQRANAKLIVSAPGMEAEIATLKADKADLLQALKDLCSEITSSRHWLKRNVRKDFSLMNAHACALKAIHKTEP